ncbi:hypothetical protein UA08_08365 [Talaromyces atroroseus]|uniref:Uncharacterized protein n=1 Tax=Talaromyces atroroseus TaxID=1441469 RepID=A0A1Q5Q7L8_TALAT|nr:hypothetical protein UA08_08365 [Talaromyces atroroseus]OKL56219.1 hypothetical protein UA08_08365 [Talaromyces atroroseus]
MRAPRPTCHGSSQGSWLTPYSPLLAVSTQPRRSRFWHTQIEMTQTSREVLNTKSNTNRLLEALCAPTPQGTRPLKNSASFSHMISSSSSTSWVQGWNQKLPSQLSSVPSNSLSSGSTPLTPFPAQEDLEVYLERTNTEIINPLRRHPDKIVNKANLAIQSTQDTTIAHRKFAAVRLIRKPDWIKAFGDDTCIKRRIWGVVVRGVHCSVDPKDPQFKVFLKSDNAPILQSQGMPPMNITCMGWLLGDKKIKE